MKFNFFSSSSILKKFLVFNLIVFLFLGIFTYLYLKAIEPNLIRDRSKQHVKIINNTSDHINRLNIKFNKDGITNFLLSTRFLFQNLDRVQFYDLNSNLLADTDTLDLVQDIFVINQEVQETSIDESNEKINFSESPKAAQTATFNTESYVRYYSENKNIKDKLVISETINNNFYVMTVDVVKKDGESKGFIIVNLHIREAVIKIEE